MNLIYHFCALIDFKHTDLRTPLAPLMGEIDVHVRELFCTKFNSEQLSFEAFFDVMRILGSVEHKNESI